MTPEQERAKLAIEAASVKRRGKSEAMLAQADYAKTEARILAHYGYGAGQHLPRRYPWPFKQTRKQRRIAAQLKRVRPLLGVGPHWRAPKG